jgi:hypothetical protein
MLSPTPLESGATASPSATPSPAVAPKDPVQSASNKASSAATTAARPWERFGQLNLEMALVTVHGHALHVTRIPAYAMDGGNYVFAPFSLVDAREYIDLADGKLELATAEVLDAMHLQGYYGAPIAQDSNWKQTGFYDTAGNMNSDYVVKELGRRWSSRLKGSDYDGKSPVVNCAKPVILDDAALSKPGYCVIRGYYFDRPTAEEKASGKIRISAMSPINKRTVAHTKGYKDLSGGGVFVSTKLPNGEDYRSLVESGALGNKPFSLDLFWRSGLT